MKFRILRILFAFCIVFISFGALAGNQCEVAFEDGNDQINFEICVDQAKNGDAQAQFGYAQILMFGAGREHHAQDSLDWYRRSAQQRHFLSQTMLGRILSDERFGVSLNAIEAYAWWSASKNKDSAAKLWSRFSLNQKRKAKSLADEYISNYSSVDLQKP